MILHATFVLKNISSYKDEQKNITYHSLVTTKKIWSKKLNDFTEEIVSISIPQQFSYLQLEFSKHKNKEIMVQVRERIFDSKFSGFVIDSDQFKVIDQK